MKGFEEFGPRMNSLKNRIKRLSDRLSLNSRQMLGHASIYALGNILRQLAGFIMLPVYTRFLSPADYGVVGLMVFVISLMEPLFGARLGQAILKYYFDFKKERKEAIVVSTALIITGGASVFTMMIVFWFREPASNIIFGTSEHVAIVGCFSVLILTQAVEHYGLMYIRIQQRPWLYFGINFAKLVVQITLNVWLVVFEKMGVMGVAISTMISSCGFATLTAAYTVKEVGVKFDKQLARKMVKFSWPLWIAAFASLYIGSANRYFLRIFRSLEDIGLFELAVKFGFIAASFVWEPFSLYWNVERFRYYHRDNAELVFQRVFSFISTFMFLAALGIAIFAGPVIRIMANPAFYRAAEAVPFVVFGTVFQGFVQFFNFCFEVKERTKWIGQNLYLTAVIITVFYVALIPLLGHTGAGMAFLFGNSIQFVIVYSASRKLFDMGISVWPLLWMVCVCGFACWLANWIILNESLVQDIVVKGFVYAFSCVLLILPIARNGEIERVVKQILPGIVMRNNK